MSLVSCITIAPIPRRTKLEKCPRGRQPTMCPINTIANVILVCIKGETAVVCKPGRARTRGSATTFDMDDKKERKHFILHAHVDCIPRPHTSERRGPAPRLEGACWRHLKHCCHHRCRQRLAAGPQPGSGSDWCRPS